MKAHDIAQLLESFGFQHLTPQNIEGSNFTFKFGTHDYRYLVKTFGEPTIAGKGKVAVFEIPSYGRLGVSPTNSMVRLAYKGNHAQLERDDSHLAKLETNKALQLLFAKAQTGRMHRLKYLEEAIAFFNRTKFYGKLPKIKIMCTVATPKIRGIDGGTRAFFAPAGAKSYLWFRDGLFNADEHFVNEIIVHEMCHQATYVDLGYVEQDEQGHGPKWQAWMRKVGLDPRRFDPTESQAYKDRVTQNLEEEELTLQYGARTPKSFFQKKKPAPEFEGPGVEYAFVYKGRACVGHFKQVGSKYHFKGVAPNGKTFNWVLAKWMSNFTWENK